MLQDLPYTVWQRRIVLCLIVISPFATAQIVKHIVDLDVGYAVVETADVLDVGFSEDRQGRIKLTHHRDGFVQFSGYGIVSGRDKVTRQIKGIGVDSYPLDKPVRGPGFGLSFTGVSAFTQLSGENLSLSFRREELCVPPRIALAYSLEGHIFPWRLFVRESTPGQHTIDISHPAGAVVRSRVIFPPDNIPVPYFMGLEMFAEPFQAGMPPHSFAFGGATGNLRTNKEGHVLADAIHCIYPAGTPIRRGRSLDYVMRSVDQLRMGVAGTR